MTAPAVGLACAVDAFAPWREEIATLCGLEGAQRCLVAGRGAAALADSLRSGNPVMQCMCLDAAGHGADGGALFEWYRSPATLPRSDCVIRCFLPEDALLREALTPSAGALLRPRGRIVAIDWFDGAFDPVARGPSAISGAAARFQRLAARHAEQGRDTRLLRGAFRRVDAEQAGELLRRLRPRENRPPAALRDEPVWGALIYLVARFDTRR